MVTFAGMVLLSGETLIKKIGLLSYVAAQNSALRRLFSEVQPGFGHIIVTRTIDDTNVTVSPHSRAGRAVDYEDGADPEQDQSHVGKTGRRKVCAFLEMIQRASFRRDGSEQLQTARVQVPSQVLPKAAPIHFFQFEHCGFGLRTILKKRNRKPSNPDCCFGFTDFHLTSTEHAGKPADTKPGLFSCENPGSSAGQCSHTL